MNKAIIEPPIVDSHAHVFTQDMPLTGDPWNRPKYSYTAEDYLSELDENGIHFGVISGISIYGTYNDYMIEKLIQYPRLRGTVNISPTIDRMELRSMKDSGVVGMRLFLSPYYFGDIPDIKSEEYQRLFRRIRDLDWHIHFLADADIFDETLSVLLATGVKLVVDHFARPDLTKGLNCSKLAATLKAMEIGNTWTKISAGYRFAPGDNPRTEADYVKALEHEHELASYFIANAGPERLLWGSDAPFVDHESMVSFKNTLDWFAHSVPDPAVRRKISDTALKLYFS